MSQWQRTTSGVGTAAKGDLVFEKPSIRCDIRHQIHILNYMQSSSAPKYTSKKFCTKILSNFPHSRISSWIKKRRALMKSFNTLLLVAVLLFKQTHPCQREQQQSWKKKKWVRSQASSRKAYSSIIRWCFIILLEKSPCTTFFLSLFPTPAAARRTLSHTRSSIASLFCPRFFFLIPSSNNQTEQPSWLSWYRHWTVMREQNSERKSAEEKSIFSLQNFSQFIVISSIYPCCRGVKKPLKFVQFVDTHHREHQSISRTYQAICVFFMILISPDPWTRETFAHGNARSLLMILSGCVRTEIIINFSLCARRLAELCEDHAIFIRAPPRLTQHEAASGDDLWCEFQRSACRHEEGEKANTLTRVWKRNMKNKTEEKTTKRNARVLISLDNSTRRVGCVKKLSIFEGEEEKNYIENIIIHAEHCVLVCEAQAASSADRSHT